MKNGIGEKKGRSAGKNGGGGVTGTGFAAMRAGAEAGTVVVVGGNAGRIESTLQKEEMRVITVRTEVMVEQDGRPRGLKSSRNDQVDKRDQTTTMRQDLR